MINLENDKLTAEIMEEGAYLFSLKYQGKVDLLLPGKKERKTRGGMALLIPFANRIKGGSYSFEGKTYFLPVNSEGNAIHGFAKDMKWHVVESGDESVTLSLELSHDGYPSRLICNVTYQLDGFTLKVIMEVKNVGENNAPITVGAHPYFIVDGKWDLLPKELSRLKSKDKIPTGEIEKYTVDCDLPIDDCFLFDGSLTLTSKRSQVKVESDNMKFIQIYNGIPGAVAIEPMSGAPDAFHNGMGLEVLSPRDTTKHDFTLTFSSQSL